MSVTNVIRLTEVRLRHGDVHHGAVPGTETAGARFHLEPFRCRRLHLESYHAAGDVGHLDPGGKVTVRVGTEDDVLTGTESQQHGLFPQ